VNMPKGIDTSLSHYQSLVEAANFFLYTAFYHIHQARELEVAGIIFGKKIMSINPEPDWKIPSMPDKLLPFIRSDIQVLSDETSNKMADAWETAQVEAHTSKLRLAKKHPIVQIEIIGHVINLAACIETATNRQLLLLREEGKIDDSHYAIMERSETLSKILFCFKDEILNNKLSTSQLKYLFKLRNHAVHFKASGSDKVTPTVEELLQIWKNVGDLFKLIEGEPTEKDVAGYMDSVVSRWIES